MATGRRVEFGVPFCAANPKDAQNVTTVQRNSISSYASVGKFWRGV